MNVSGLRELDEMASKLEATIHELPQVKRDKLLPDIERIRAQLTALLSAFNAQPGSDAKVRAERVVWSRKFEVPIALPNGQKITTLRDAADYIIGLPPETVKLLYWQLAMEALSQVTEQSPTTLARRAFLRALSGDAQG
jgi:hypothetical protein